MVISAPFQVSHAAVREVKREVGAPFGLVRRCPRNGKRAKSSRCHCAVSAWEGDGFMTLASPETGLILRDVARCQ